MNQVNLKGGSVCVGEGGAASPDPGPLVVYGLFRKD